jgi:phosphoenolpyruvate carboxylase
MVSHVESCKSDHLKNVARSFAQFLALSNCAENYHRIRRLRENIRDSGLDLPLPNKVDSIAGGIKHLVDHHGLESSEVLDILRKQTTEIVLTAHPTEVNRRTMIRKYQKIEGILEKGDRADLLSYEYRQLQNALEREVSSIWDSDELRRSKPSPVDEAKAGLAIAETVLWNAVPMYMRKMDDVTTQILGQPLPLDIAPIKIASWMGGDRDGNPNVTPETTLEVAMLSRWMAAYLFKGKIAELRAELSLKVASPEVMEAAGYAREPYREILRDLEDRLEATMEWTNCRRTKVPYTGEMEPLRYSKDLMDPLQMMHASLTDLGHSEIADGLLIDTIRCLAAFGLSLMPMDIRQESTRHTEALDAITNFLDLGSYSDWDEQARRKWLEEELRSRRPLLPKGRKLDSYGFSPTVVDTLETFEVAASLEPGSLGAYVISQCQQASDILAVMLLQQESGVYPELRVVPLFETLDDLTRAPDTVRSLFSIDTYKKRINGHQEVMVGYSDSAKDAGRLAASWAQYIAQESMVSVADEAGVKLTFFHGKGGTVGRGGNPAVFKAILAHPPNTINGRFRVTEQGEMITQNFGQISMAQNALDLMTAGVLAERFEKRPHPKPEWREMMQRLSDVSCEAYRGVVREDPRFVPYFRTATPELDLAALNVGSRPAKRNSKGGVESLRAIPWVFAWTQTRFNLPTWLGVGEALEKELETNSSLLQEMYREWPWFSTVIDLLEMILVKSEERVAQNYDDVLVEDPLSRELGEELREKMKLATKGVLAITGNETLSARNPTLLRSLEVRNPYVDPLNIIQAELLKRLRVQDVEPEEKLVLQDALLITINGVANGMRNSG